MKGFWTSSIGKKLLMSLSGLFLIVFLLVHLVMNLTMLFDPVNGEVYNLAANFMSTNPLIKIIEPVLAIGFFVHILYGVVVQVNNWKSRGNNKYAVVDQKESSSWASRNMIWLGIFIFGFLVVHIINFYVIIKFGEPASVTINGKVMHDTFKLVVGLFEIWWYDLIYIISFIALGLHLHHAFWSAFQTIGFNNKLWQKRLVVIGDIYTYIIVIGFSIIPLYFLIF
jgi:succinate dehydrogenase / fumarate reductase cytochrome b subunit